MACSESVPPTHQQHTSKGQGALQACCQASLYDHKYTEGDCICILYLKRLTIGHGPLSGSPRAHSLVMPSSQHPVPLTIKQNAIRGLSFGMYTPTKTDEFSEKFRRGFEPPIIFDVVYFETKCGSAQKVRRFIMAGLYDHISHDMPNYFTIKYRAI